jgi:hypothetical protein
MRQRAQCDGSVIKLALSKYTKHTQPAFNTVQALSAKVLQRISERQLFTGFNGVHLRMEKDASDWTMLMGGRARLWQRYKQSMRMAGFDDQTPLYVASGLLKASVGTDPQPRLFLRKLASDLVLSGVRHHRHF